MKQLVVLANYTYNSFFFLQNSYSTEQCFVYLGNKRLDRTNYCLHAASCEYIHISISTCENGFTSLAFWVDEPLTSRGQYFWTGSGKWSISNVVSPSACHLTWVSTEVTTATVSVELLVKLYSTCVISLLRFYLVAMQCQILLTNIELSPVSKEKMWMWNQMLFNLLVFKATQLRVDNWRNMSSLFRQVIEQIYFLQRFNVVFIKEDTGHFRIGIDMGRYSRLSFKKDLSIKRA